MRELILVNQHDSSNADLVTFDRLTIGNLSAVDVGAKGRTKVFNPKLAALLGDDAVMPGNALVRDLDVAVAAASEFARFVRQLEHRIEVI